MAYMYLFNSNESSMAVYIYIYIYIYISAYFRFIPSVSLWYSSPLYLVGNSRMATLLGNRYTFFSIRTVTFFFCDFCVVFFPSGCPGVGIIILTVSINVPCILTFIFPKIVLFIWRGWVVVMIMLSFKPNIRHWRRQ